MTAPEQITVQELLARAERDELLTILELRLLLEAQHTPVSRSLIQQWADDGTMPVRRIDGHPRAVRIAGREILAVLAWRRTYAA